MFSRGLIIGKFLPLHRGHQFLIEAALGQTNKLVIVIFDNHKFSIPGSVRKGWIERLYPQAEALLIQDSGLDYATPSAWQEHATLLRRHVTTSIDAVFSSEDYGGEVAALFGARHILVDRDRRNFPVSGSSVIKNPSGYRAFLDPLVFADLQRLSDNPLKA